MGLSGRLRGESTVEDRRTRVPTLLHLDLAFGSGEDIVLREVDNGQVLG